MRRARVSITDCWSHAALFARAALAAFMRWAAASDKSQLWLGQMPIPIWSCKSESRARSSGPGFLRSPDVRGQLISTTNRSQNVVKTSRLIFSTCGHCESLFSGHIVLGLSLNRLVANPGNSGEILGNGWRKGSKSASSESNVVKRRYSSAGSWSLTKLSIALSRRNSIRSVVKSLRNEN